MYADQPEQRGCGRSEPLSGRGAAACLRGSSDRRWRPVCRRVRSCPLSRLLPLPSLLILRTPIKSRNAQQARAGSQVDFTHALHKAQSVADTIACLPAAEQADVPAVILIKANALKALVRGWAAGRAKARDVEVYDAHAITALVDAREELDAVLREWHEAVEEQARREHAEAARAFGYGDQLGYGEAEHSIGRRVARMHEIDSEAFIARVSRARF